MFTNPTEIKQYALAGYATVTLTSQRTGARYTYKINQAKDRDTGKPKPLWFVSLMTGPDNEADYRYMGLLNGEFKLTGKSQYDDKSLPVRAFRFFWHHVNGDRMPPELDVRHAGTCGHCGRKLTTPESIDSGIGPICRAKMGM